MRCSLLPFWMANLLFCLGLLLHCGEAKVLTEVQAGPLYRVVGTALSISCNVSGFASASSQKHFEFRVAKPAAPTFNINIISTNARSFPYTMYAKRVTEQEITLKSVSVNSVIFEIKHLEKDDEGEYECSVINSEGTWNGIYSATTTVKVIDNSLSVSSPVSTSLNKNEGDPLTLTCQASSNTIQHTHLSFAWYLQNLDEDGNRPIISLDRDFTLSPGRGFEERYQAGLIRLDKMGEATYRLNMAQLEVSDQGRIYCQAQEWIQDPDRSWYSIIQKDAAPTTLHVKARGVVPDITSLVVRISTQQTSLQEGQELSLSCNIDTQNLEKRFFSVAWLRGVVELARVGPTGVLSVGPEYSGREKGGELRATRIGDRDYRLILQPVRSEDQGEYVCKAWPQDRGQDGAFTMGAAHVSSAQRVTISATESGLSVAMQSSVSVNEGDRLQLTCKVNGVKGQLSVSWQHKPTSTSMAPFTNVISLSQEGVMEIDAKFTSRKVRATRPAADNFTLELDEVVFSDSGVYQCMVSEWKTNSKTNSQSQSATVTVVPTDEFVKVNLISRSNTVTVGENVELMCRVRGPHMLVTLTWSLQRDASTIDNILTLKSNGDISWSKDSRGYQVKVENKPGEVIYYLLINGASHREAGSYRCSASVFLENAYKKLPPSNQVAVMVVKPVSKLILTSSTALTKDINMDIKMECSVTSEPFASSRYAVTWLHQQQAENKTIVSSDRDALVTFGTQVEVSDRQRISIGRAKGPSFELNIRQAQISDSGLYICEVVEWLQDPRGDWYQLPPVSKITKLTVIEPENDLHLNMTEQQLIAIEGDEVELKCNIISSAGPSFFYKVIWLYTGHSSSIRNAPIVTFDHTGLLKYPEKQELRGLQRRLRFIRPSQRSFCLGIQRVHEGDSGTYQCLVEQFQLDRDGHWQQKASDKGGLITLTVNVAEKKLSIVMNEVDQNVSRSQDFTIPCNIIKQSSSESEFQVTWFWQKEREAKQQPIFIAYRNATLQDMLWKSDELRFGHPTPNNFSLKVLKPGPEKSGLYFCEIEEWLPSLSHGWWKAAVERSAYLTVNVNTEAEAVSECKSGIWIGIFVIYVICSLLVIFILVLKRNRSKSSAGKKSGQSLWAEQPLTAKPSAHD